MAICTRAAVFAVRWRGQWHTCRHAWPDPVLLLQRPAAVRCGVRIWTVEHMCGTTSESVWIEVDESVRLPAALDSSPAIWQHQMD